MTGKTIYSLITFYDSVFQFILCDFFTVNDRQDVQVPELKMKEEVNIIVFKKKKIICYLD